MVERDAYIYQAQNKDIFHPVYEKSNASLLGQRLVVTPEMLLDRLMDCQEQARELACYIDQSGMGMELRYGIRVNPVMRRLQNIDFEVSQLLRLLRRGGLWISANQELGESVAANGETYRVLHQPFQPGAELAAQNEEPVREAAEAPAVEA
ncbi:MAG: hypothetical protein OHK0029_32100 [Armatimonadaceae bacterium]